MNLNRGKYILKTIIAKINMKNNMNIQKIELKFKRPAICTGLLND